MNPLVSVGRALFVAALLASALRADVLVVDLAGGGDHTDVRVAVQAASPGDIVLVRPGIHTASSSQPMTVVGKSVTILGDGAGVVVPPLLISALPAGAQVIVRHLDLRLGPGSPLSGSLLMQNSQGTLLAEDCRFEGSQGFGTFVTNPGAPAARILGGGTAIFARCEFVGGAGIDTFVPYAPTAGAGGPGLHASQAHVTIHGGTLRGGDGGDFLLAGSSPGGAGAEALRLDGGQVFVSGSTLIGGASGQGTSPGVGTPGGDGIHSAAASAVRTLDVTFVPGAGGLDPDRIAGPEGVLFDVTGAAPIQHSGVARTYTLSGPTREFESIHVSYDGAPGDLAAVFYSFGAGSFALPGKEATFHLVSPWTPLQVLAVADGAGQFSFDVPIGPFADAQFAGGALVGQCLVLTNLGQHRLSSPTIFAVIDESF